MLFGGPSPPFRSPLFPNPLTLEPHRLPFSLPSSRFLSFLQSQKHQQGATTIHLFISQNHRAPIPKSQSGSIESLTAERLRVRSTERPDHVDTATTTTKPSPVLNIRSLWDGKRKTDKEIHDVVTDPPTTPHIK